MRFFRSWFSNNSLENSSPLLPEGVSQPTEINDTTVITVAPTEKYDCLKSDGDVDNNLLANKIIATIFIPKNYEGDTAEFPEIWRDSEKANRPALNPNTNYDFLYAWAIPSIETDLGFALDISDDDTIDAKKEKINAVIQKLKEAIAEKTTTDNNTFTKKQIIFFTIYCLTTLGIILSITLNTTAKDWTINKTSSYPDSSSSENQKLSPLTIGGIIVSTGISNYFLLTLIQGCIERALLLKKGNIPVTTEAEPNAFAPYLANEKLRTKDPEERKAAVFMIFEAHLASLQEKYNMLLSAEPVVEREERPEESRSLQI